MESVCREQVTVSASWPTSAGSVAAGLAALWALIVPGDPLGVEREFMVEPDFMGDLHATVLRPRHTRSKLPVGKGQVERMPAAQVDLLRQPHTRRQRRTLRTDNRRSDRVRLHGRRTPRRACVPGPPRPPPTSSTRTCANPSPPPGRPEHVSHLCHHRETGPAAPTPRGWRCVDRGRRRRHASSSASRLRPAPIGTHTAAAVRCDRTASCTPGLMRWPTLVEDVRGPSTADRGYQYNSSGAPQRQGYSV